jgi:hypothetical protein
MIAEFSDWPVSDWPVSDWPVSDEDFAEDLDVADDDVPELAFEPEPDDFELDGLLLDLPAAGVVCGCVVCAGPC